MELVFYPEVNNSEYKNEIVETDSDISAKLLYITAIITLNAPITNLVVVKLITIAIKITINHYQYLTGL